MHIEQDQLALYIGNQVLTILSQQSEIRQLTEFLDQRDAPKQEHPAKGFFNEEE